MNADLIPQSELITRRFSKKMHHQRKKYDSNQNIHDILIQNRLHMTDEVRSEMFLDQYREVIRYQWPELDPAILDELTLDSIEMDRDGDRMLVKLSCFKHIKPIDCTQLPDKYREMLDSSWGS